MATCPNPPCPPDVTGVLNQARQQGAFGMPPDAVQSPQDASAVQQPWQSMGNPHDDYEALLGLFQQGLKMRRTGGNPDAFVSTQLGHVGAHKMSDLASMLAYVAKQGGEDVPQPSAAKSATGMGLDVASAGAGTQMHGLGQGIANLILGGGFGPGYHKGVREYQSDLGSLYAAHPGAAMAGGVTGGLAGGLLLPAGSAMDAEAKSLAGAIAGQTGERSLVPGMARGTMTGLGFGGGSGLLHQDLTNIDPKQVGIDAAMGAGTGLVLGGARGAYDRLWNPSQFYLNRALSFDEPLIEGSLEGPHPAGKPLLMESSPTGMAMGQALARINRPAALRAVANVQRSADDVAAGANKIANDPNTGYDALFENRWFTDSKTVDAWKDLTGDDTPSVSARDVFQRYKSMRRFVQSVSKARMKGQTVVSPEDDAKAIDYSQKMNVFSQALSSVPGYDELQQQMAPFLQRRSALGQVATMLQRRVRGQLGEDPARGTMEKMLQEAGYSPYEGKWRGASDLLDVLTNPHNKRTVPELRTLLNPTVPFPFQVNRLPGSVPAAAGLLAGIPTDQ